MDLIVVKFLHVLSSTFLFGTGVGTAFFLFMVSWTRDPRVVAVVARYVVIADWIFTTTTIVIQPISGVYLARGLGIPLTTPWLYWSLVFYAIAALCWLPVVWLQIRLRNLAVEAVSHGEALPVRYFGTLGIWAALGVPALLAFIAIFWLMVAKPAM